MLRLAEARFYSLPGTSLDPRPIPIAFFGDRRGGSWRLAGDDLREVLRTRGFVVHLVAVILETPGGRE